MDLVLKGRGIRITDKVRLAAEHKLRRLDRRRRPLVQRLEVEVIGERNPRIGQSHRVEIACETPHHTFHAAGAGPDVDTALDSVVARLERQIATYRSKRATRSSAKGIPPELRPPRDRDRGER
jgi:ribosomal subunit interface protein